MAVNGEASESTECIGTQLMVPDDGRVRRFVRSKEWQKTVAIAGSSLSSGEALGLLSSVGGAVIVSLLKIYTCSTPVVLRSTINYIHIAQRSKRGVSHLLSQKRQSQIPPAAHISRQSSFFLYCPHYCSLHPLRSLQLPPDQVILFPIARPRQPHALYAPARHLPRRSTSTTPQQNP